MSGSVPDAVPGPVPEPAPTRRSRRRRRVGDQTPQLLRSPLSLVTAVVAVWLATTWLLWPNLGLLASTFVKDGHLSLSAWDKLMSSSRARASLGHSFLLAVTLCVTVNAVGIFIVLVTEYFKVWGSRILALGYSTTFIYGGIVLAAGYKFVYGETGIMTPLVRAVFPSLPAGWFTGYWAVVFVMTFATTTNHMLFLTAALAKVDNQTIEAARNMGAGPLTILWRVVLPVLRPVLFAVTILSFLTGLGALSAPLVVGGREFQTIAPMILAFANSTVSRDIAALLAILLGVATMILLWVMTRIERGQSYFSVSKVATRIEKQQLTNPVANAALHVVAWLVWLVYVAPVVFIVLFSFQPSRAIAMGRIDWGGFGLGNYSRVFGQSDALRPLLTSIAYSGAAALICVVAMLFVARMITRYPGWLSNLVENLMHIPWLLPSTMLALGLLMAYNTPSPFMFGRTLTGTLWPLLAAYVLVKIPFTLRLLKAAFTGINSSLEEAAANLGASALTTFRRVLVPLVMPTAAAIGALNFNSQLDDYDMAVFLSHPLYQPLGLTIAAATDSQASTDAVANNLVYTVVLMITMATVMILVNGDWTARVGRLRRITRRRTEVTA